MIAIKATIDLSGISAMRKSDINPILKDSFADRGLMWHKDFRKRHFTLDAMRRYGYQPRTKGYNRRKIKRLGAPIPLVFTGVSRALSGMGTITATKNQVTIRSPIRAFNFKPKTRSGGTPPDMRDEYSRMTDDEIQAMDQRQTQLITKRCNAFPKRRAKVEG